MLLIAFLFTLLGVIPFEVTSLFFALIQTLTGVMAIYETEEENEMTDRFIIGGGTHGVVQNCWVENAITSAE